MPLSMGGLGVTRGADILPHAFLASICQTHKLQDRILGSWEVPWVEAVHVAKDSLGRILPDFDMSLLDDPLFSDSQLQFKLGSLLSDHYRRALLALPAQERVVEVVQSAGRPHAAAWLQALPVARLGQCMSLVEFRCRLKYHLLIPIYPVGTWCSRCASPMDIWGDHAVQCRVGAGVANTYRHNCVRDCLYRMARDLRLPVGREPSFPVPTPDLGTRRPDLVFPDWDRGRDFYYDVVGTSPLALSLRGDFTPGGAVARAATNKLQYYRNHRSRQPPRVVFRPFAFDTFGGLHGDAVELLQRLQGVVSQAALVHIDMAWYSMVRRVGFTIARAVGRQLATRLPGWSPVARGAFGGAPGTVGSLGF